jgi:flagellar hook-associated protein 3 FlgL
VTSAISTRAISSSLAQSVVKLQSEFATRTKELSTGRHNDLGLTLGNRTAVLVSLRYESDTLQTLSDTNEFAATRLGTTESKLASIQSTAEDFLNTLLTSGSSTLHAGTVQSAAETKLSSLIADLDSSLGGDYLFAGTNTGTRPVADYAPSSSPKLAVDAAFFTAFGFSQASPQVPEIGGAEMQAFLDTQFAALFQDPNWGDIWSSAADQPLTDRISPSRMAITSVTANEAPFSQLAQAYTMLADLGTQDLGADAYDAVVSTAGTLLRSAISGLTDLRSDVGAMQSEVSDASEQMSLQMSLLSKQVGTFENVDPYEVSSRLSELQTQLEASYFMTAQLRDLSLTNYL